MKNPILSKVNFVTNSIPTSDLKNTETNFQYFQNLVISYVYQETSLLENIKIELLLQENDKLNQFFYEIVNLKKQMDDCQTRHKPSSQLIDKILKYSKK